MTKVLTLVSLFSASIGLNAIACPTTKLKLNNDSYMTIGKLCNVDCSESLSIYSKEISQNIIASDTSGKATHRVRLSDQFSSKTGEIFSSSWTVTDIESGKTRNVVFLGKSTKATISEDNTDLELPACQGTVDFSSLNSENKTAEKEIKSGTEILSGNFNVDPTGTYVSIKVNTEYGCNEPKAELKYVSSGRASFGPHTYKLVVTPLNRMLCLASEDKIFNLKLPRLHNMQDQVVIEADKSSNYKFIVN